MSQWIGVAALAVGSLVTGVIFGGSPSSPPEVSFAGMAEESRLTVHVTGAVVDPGLVVVDGGARVADAVAAAGGLTPAASLTALNLATPLRDGMQVVVPTSDGAGTGISNTVSMSSASSEELAALPGVGPVLAQRDHRPPRGTRSIRDHGGPSECVRHRRGQAGSPARCRRALRFSNLPRGPGAVAVATGLWSWSGAAAGRVGAHAVTAAVLIALFSRHRRRTVAVVLIAGAAGMASMGRETSTLHGAVPEQAQVLSGVAASDGGHGGFAFLPSHVVADGSLAEWRGPRLWVRSSAAVEARQRLVVEGEVTGGGFRTRFGPVAGSVSRAEVTVVSGPGLWMSAGSALRKRVRGVFAEGGPGPALVTGFLIGDTSEVSEVDLESLRLSGLSHFVAVSGSNVALFVGGWWILAGLVLVDGRWRAITSLVVLAVFVIATRWEPSVVRASVMAAIVLGGRIVGRQVPAWSALGVAVAAIVVAAPELVASVGFQLSVAATAGVLATAGTAKGWIGTTVAATVGAQLAVAPLLLAHFGAVPLLAPAANVVAAPLVTAATAVGALAAITGLSVASSIAGGLADAVTLVARAFAAGPQLGWLGVAGMALVVVLIKASRWRPLGIAALAAVLILSAAPSSVAHRPEAVFLDVGQGDAMLSRGGGTILIDGGPEPSRLREALRSYGVRRIDLAVLSHPHADHITGLAAALDAFVVGRLWYPAHAEGDPALDELLALAARRGVPAEAPPVGGIARVGPFVLEVLGPLRRYASINDGSLVVAVSAGGPRLLAAGDIETFAQSDLDPGQVDILKVPHQGAATSDLDWLRLHGGSVAVISVGPNSYGHPSSETIAALRAGGSTVLRTDISGDVVIPLSSDG